LLLLCFQLPITELFSPVISYAAAAADDKSTLVLRSAAGNPLAFTAGCCNADLMPLLLAAAAVYFAAADYLRCNAPLTSALPAPVILAHLLLLRLLLLPCDLFCCLQLPITELFSPVISYAAAAADDKSSSLALQHSSYHYLSSSSHTHSPAAAAM
jgi:hypothetical protein